MMDTKPFSLKDLPQQDCRIELELCKDFGKMILPEIGVPDRGPSQEALILLTVSQMLKQGKPVCVIILPPDQPKFEASNKETFKANLERLSALRPIIIVTGGK
jgi:hypothetical protein